MDFDEYPPRSRTVSPAAAVVVLLLVACIGLSLLAFTAARTRNAEVGVLRLKVASLSKRLQELDGQSTTIAGRLDTTEARLREKTVGVAPLAARVLKSVFTVQTRDGLGSGFAAWVEDGRLYVITADHVVADAGAEVRLERKEGSWTAEVVGRDAANDLALLRVSGRPVGAAPLWQRPVAKPPSPGSELLLAGSPFGLSGTVTTGIVSRVSRTLIQTDAAANPGSSGGPAVDRQGRLVGVLVAGGGENINFAVPIQRVCVSLRSC